MPINPLVASTLITSGANIGSTIGTNIMNRSNAKSTARYQNMLNTENWRMQNAYNTPLAQMQRLKSAGLNPNLIYQSGLDNTAGSVAAPQVQNPVAEAPQFDFVNDYVQMKHSANETRQVDSIVDTAKTTQALNSANEALMRSMKKLNDKDLSWKDKLNSSQLLNQQYQTLNYLASSQKLEAETGLTRRQCDVFYQDFHSKMANEQVQREVGMKNIALMHTSIHELEQKIAESKSRTKLNDVEFARGLLAKAFDEATNDYFLSNGNYNLHSKLDLELREIEARIRNMNTSNVTNPISQLVLPLVLLYLGRGKKLPPIGFKH